MDLTKNNLKLATQYALGKDKQFNTKDEDYKNLFLSYVTDNNSSTIREAVTLNHLGYKQYQDKHGADGIDEARGILVEVKPKGLKAFTKNGKAQKHGGGGNFNDMTMELLESKMGFNVVCSGFLEGRLVYSVEFPIHLIREQLEKRIRTAKIGKRVVCSFSHTHYDSDLLTVHYFDEALAKTILNGPHFNMLKKRNVSVSK
jgi:hypothetical protein